MAGSKKQVGDIAGIIAAAAGVAGALAPVVTPVANTVANRLQEKTDEKKWIVVPALYDKEFPLGLEQVTELLINCGLKVVPSKLSVCEARPKYKDCFDLQVIGSKPKHKQKMQLGEIIFVRYITQEVIDESRRLAEEVKKGKAERLLARNEQRARAKETIVVAADYAKKQIGKAFIKKTTK